MNAAIANNDVGINYYDLHISPVALHLGIFDLRWYSLGYLAGIFIGYWYLLKLIAQPGAPLARRHADDLVFYSSLGIIFGGRIGYVLFYNLGYYLQHPLQILKLWDGGMSFHGGVIGTTIGILYLARKEGLNWLRVHDYVACCAPFGLGLVRIANFINGELWGRPTEMPWGVAFPAAGRLTRHPSQLYEAALEGLVLFCLLAFLIRAGALKRPGLVTGVFAAGYAVARIISEFFREPDPQLGFLWGELTMGMLLSLPLLLAGLIFILFALWRPARRN